jgi:hypothetical protein
MFTIIHVNVLDVNDAVIIDNKSTVKLSVSKKRFLFFLDGWVHQGGFPNSTKGDLSSHIAITAIVNSGDESAIESAAVVWRKTRHRRGFQRV